MVATIEVTLDGPAGPQGIAADDQHVWVGVPYDGQVVVIDAETNKVAARVDTDASCGEIGVLDDAVWVTNCFESDDVSVIDRTRGRLLGSFRVGGPAGTPLLIEGQVWLATIELDGVTPATLVRVDPESFEILDAVVADPPSFIVGYGFGSVWAVFRGRRARSSDSPPMP